MSLYERVVSTVIGEEHAPGDDVVHGSRPGKVDQVFDHKGVKHAVVKFPPKFKGAGPTTQSIPLTDLQTPAEAKKAAACGPGEKMTFGTCRKVEKPTGSDSYMANYYDQWAKRGHSSGD